ncbi:hypothetical protein [Acetobacter malorum]|uniref:hypothetical protein n=1 Tax=Acetobacter malorum TaxID=178901 RepID=UPI0007781879|nr:hypothetical protein [Acetobacter malorum]
MIPYSILSSTLGLSPEHADERPVPIPRSLLLLLIENYLRTQPFDEEAYLRTNPDVADAVRAGLVPSAREHYATRGYWEERDGAAPPFCEDWYLRQNPDVAIAVQRGECPSAAAHYIHYGRKEGRCPSPEQADLYTTWQAFAAPVRRQAA